MSKRLVNIIRKIISETVSPDIVYHGTDSKFNTFNTSKPVFFVDSIDVAKTYGNNVIKAKLDIDNPIEFDFEGKSTFYFLDKWYLPSELATKIKEISDDIKSGYAMDDELRDYLQEFGFSDAYGDLDGIVMKNISDAKDGMFSKHKPATNYVVFNRSQIKIVK